MTKQQIGTFRDVGRLLAFSASFMAGVACADTTWNNSAGGDMADPNNWSNGLPSSGTTAINPPISGSLTLSQDINTGSSYIWFNNSGNSSLDLTLNLGAERTLTCPSRTFVKPNAVVTLASGTWKMTGDRFFVGDNWNDSTFIVDSANSALYGHTTGNYYIEVGSANGSDSKNNLLLVRNGGLVNGGVIVGRLAKPDPREFCGTNTFHVTGLGSRLISSLYPLIVGGQQGLSQAIFDDHATATLASGQHVRIGNPQMADSRWYAGDRNRLLVSGGALLDVSGNVYVGETSASNVFEVTDGAQAAAAGLYASYTTNALVKNGRAPFGNRVVVRGEDSELRVKGTSYLGYASGSHGDSLLIADGAVFTNGASFYIGYDGWANALCVTNGSTWHFGGNAYVLLGHHSRSNMLEIASGGKIVLTSQLRHSFNQLPDGSPNGWNTLWIHGEGAELTTTSPIRVGRFADCFCDAMRIEDGGVLLQTGGEFQTPCNAKLNEVGARGGTASNFVLSITGTGSVYDYRGGEFAFCCNTENVSTNMFNRIYVADGGLLSIAGTSCLIGCGKSVETAYCEDNMLHVGPGGRFLQVVANGNDSGQKNFRLGHNASARRNTVRVEGTFAYTNTSAAYSTSPSNVRIGSVGASNRLEVVNGGDMTVNGASFILGHDVAAIGNMARVGTNSVLRLANMDVAHIGWNGHSSRLTVDGGIFDAYDTWRLCVGSNLSASNAVFEVLNGATATVTRLVFADKAPNCTAVISNATLNIVSHTDMGGNSINAAGYLDLAYSAVASGSDPANMRFVIAGRNGKVRAAEQVRIRNASAKIVFQIPAEGFAETPLVVKNFAEVTQGASIVVEAAEDWPYGAKQTLVELASGQTFSAAANNLAVTCNDDRLCVRRSTNRIYVHKPNGTIIVFK